MKRIPYKILIIVLLIIIALGGALALSRTTNPTSFIKPEVVTPQPVETKLFFAGDIMLSRNVASAIYKDNIIELPYTQTKNRIESADIAFANLESPFNNEGDHSVQGSLVFNADPKFVSGLTSAGFDILSTANNHAFDQGKKGVEYTLNLLSENGIVAVGTGLDCHDGKIIEKNGIKFGFLAYSYSAYNDGGRVPDPLVCDWSNDKQITTDITKLKPRVDFLIVSSHMGAEYKRVPEEANALKARATIDAGADMFIGHHPHWVQTMEEYKDKYIFYSLGNFIFDQMWSQDTREGLALEVLFKDKKLSRITLLPVIIDNYCCPRWANELETKSILNKINLTNTKLIPKNEEVN